jgi:tetratricopeptide (TPR) repeat protein
MRTSALLPVVLVSLASFALAQSSPRAGYVTIKETGEKIYGKISEKGDLVIVDRGAKGTVGLDASKVAITYTDDGTSEGTPAAAPNAEADLVAYSDFDGRFVFQRPGADWKLKRSASPEARVIASLAGKAAFVTVSARAVDMVPPGYQEVTRDSARKIQPLVEAELRSELDKVQGLVCDQGELFGTPVLECRFEASFPSEALVYRLVELRFARGGILYAVRGAGDREHWKELEPLLREAFTSFSFMPAQGGDDESYHDLVTGFGVVRPSTRWTIDARPFDEKDPVRLKNEDDRAEIRVASAAAAARDAAAFLNELEARVQVNKDFVAKPRKTARRDGTEVVLYDWEYYEPGSAKKREFEGIVAVVGDQIVHVEGISPLGDRDTRQLQQEVQRSLDGFRLLDAKALRQHLADGARAIEELGKGLEAQKKKAPAEAAGSFAEAIRLYPEFARAYSLRARANLDQKLWKEFRADLDRFLELDTRPEAAGQAAQLFIEEARLREADNQLKEACLAWREALKKDSRLKKEFLRFFEDEVKKIPAKDLAEKVELIVDKGWQEDHTPAGKESDQKLANLIAQAGETLITDKTKLKEAQGLAQKALGFDPLCARAKALAKRCEDAKKK